MGFGISTPAQAATVAVPADGAIIGSALVDLVARSAGPADACALAARFVGSKGGGR